jgi:hypothetical protein
VPLLLDIRPFVYGPTTEQSLAAVRRYYEAAAAGLGDSRLVLVVYPDPGDLGPGSTRQLFLDRLRRIVNDRSYEILLHDPVQWLISNLPHYRPISREGGACRVILLETRPERRDRPAATAE